MQRSWLTVRVYSQNPDGQNGASDRLRWDSVETSGNWLKVARNSSISSSVILDPLPISDPYPSLRFHQIHSKHAWHSSLTYAHVTIYKVYANRRHLLGITAACKSQTKRPAIQLVITSEWTRNTLLSIYLKCLSWSQPIVRQIEQPQAGKLKGQMSTPQDISLLTSVRRAKILISIIPHQHRITCNNAFNYVKMYITLYYSQKWKLTVPAIFCSIKGWGQIMTNNRKICWLCNSLEMSQHGHALTIKIMFRFQNTDILIVFAMQKNEGKQNDCLEPSIVHFIYWFSGQ